MSRWRARVIVSVVSRSAGTGLWRFPWQRTSALRHTHERQRDAHGQPGRAPFWLSQQATMASVAAQPSQMRRGHAHCQPAGRTSGKFLCVLAIIYPREVPPPTTFGLITFRWSVPAASSSCACGCGFCGSGAQPGSLFVWGVKLLVVGLGTCNACAASTGIHPNRSPSSTSDVPAGREVQAKRPRLFTVTTLN